MQNIQVRFGIIEIIGGIDVEIIRILAKEMGFSFNFIPERSWGHIVNDTWFGVTGSVRLSSDFNLLRFQLHGYTNSRFQRVFLPWESDMSQFYGNATKLPTIRSGVTFWNTNGHAENPKKEIRLRMSSLPFPHTFGS